MCYLQVGPFLNGQVILKYACLSKHIVLTNVEPYPEFTVLDLQTSAFILHRNNTKTTTELDGIHNPAIHLSIVCLISKYLLCIRVYAPTFNGTTTRE